MSTPLAIQGTVLTPDSDAYSAALRRNSDLSSLPAKVIAQPAVYDDIPAILTFAKSSTPPLEIAIKGGGAHSSTWASSDGGLVIDLAKLNKVSVSLDRKSVSVQGGALWGDVYEVLAKEDLDVVGGSLWFVGVGGFTLGGGYGPLSGIHGFAIDNLLSATVVLADGRIVNTSVDEEPDLFWAIRGGGSQFGVVVEFVFKLHPHEGPYGSGVLAYKGQQLANVIKVIQTWKTTQTPFERLTLLFSRPAPHFQPSVVVLPWVAQDKDGVRSKSVLAPFREGSIKPVFEQYHTVPDMLAVSHAADAGLATAPRRLSIRGTIFSDFFPELLLGVWEKWVSFTEGNEDVKASAVIWDLTSPDKFTEVDVDSTALKTRDSHYYMAVQGRSMTDASVAAVREFTSSTVAYVRKKNTQLSGEDLGWSVNLCAGDEPVEGVFGRHLPRLREVKKKYDPEQTWKKGVFINA